MNANSECFDCENERSNARWCKDCEYIAFKENFRNWTSGTWIDAIDVPDSSELSEQFSLIERLEKNRSQQQIHPEAMYTSRFLYFPELYNPTENVCGRNF
ncbi:8286_t:CDS:2 [Funneliformis caledonium]|uniref:8286_t:CDS:1 n=1 Tax=Funneliformis caledonium TaxID=1117310 RepID=A0A9N8WHZ8_9GLOM|nr:8286_t:CDS:2 [Funneliformis caledonium]